MASYVVATGTNQPEHLESFLPPPVMPFSHLAAVQQAEGNGFVALLSHYNRDVALGVFFYRSLYYRWRARAGDSMSNREINSISKQSWKQYFVLGGLGDVRYLMSKTANPDGTPCPLVGLFSDMWWHLMLGAVTQGQGDLLHSSPAAFKTSLCPEGRVHSLFATAAAWDQCSVVQQFLQPRGTWRFGMGYHPLKPLQFDKLTRDMTRALLDCCPPSERGQEGEQMIQEAIFEQMGRGDVEHIKMLCDSLRPMCAPVVSRAQR